MKRQSSMFFLTVVQMSSPPHLGRMLGHSDDHRCQVCMPLMSFFCGSYAELIGCQHQSLHFWVVRQAQLPKRSCCRCHTQSNWGHPRSMRSIYRFISRWGAERRRRPSVEPSFTVPFYVIMFNFIFRSSKELRMGSWQFISHSSAVTKWTLADSSAVRCRDPLAHIIGLRSVDCEYWICESKSYFMHR